MLLPWSDSAEWLEADGLGGFAMGTVTGRRTRRYHALLLVAATPPTGRMVLVNGLEVWLRTAAGSFSLSAQRYLPDVVHPDGHRRIETFDHEPWPRWRYHLEDDTRVEQEVFVPHGAPLVAVSWRLLGVPREATLFVRPLLSGRDYHHLHHENPGFRFEPKVQNNRIRWYPYEGVPGIVVLTNGVYDHQPEWYRHFLYTEEQARGLDHVEDLASPGVFQWDLGKGGDAVLLLAQDGQEAEVMPAGITAEACLKSLRADEKRRRERFPSPLHRAADAYIVHRGNGKTIIAGYPWFTDWGRDTFISLRGLCLASGRLEDARAILLEWAGLVSRGMLPNRFPDHGNETEFNTADAALWFVVAVHDYLQAMKAQRKALPPDEVRALHDTVEAILDGYTRGTRYGIRLDLDGLLAAGVPGGGRGGQGPPAPPVTWMDAKAGNRDVTPRVGKPVEIQALWLNALWVAGQFSAKWVAPLDHGREAFRHRFWNDTAGYLHDVVDADHHPGTAVTLLRPNQILAVGGLPLPLVEGERARRVVDAVEACLWTPLGLRTLAPGMPGYCGHCEGGVEERDRAYHQGTAWPWLAGPFVEAWVRVRGGTAEAKRQAHGRFVEPLLRHLHVAGLGHVSEIADGDAPHTPRGCPFQAWSLAELQRLLLVVLEDAPAKAPHPVNASPRPGPLGAGLPG